MCESSMIVMELLGLLVAAIQLLWRYALLPAVAPEPAPAPLEPAPEPAPEPDPEPDPEPAPAPPRKPLVINDAISIHLFLIGMSFGYREARRDYPSRSVLSTGATRVKYYWQKTRLQVIERIKREPTTNFSFIEVAEFIYVSSDHGLFRTLNHESCDLTYEELNAVLDLFFTGFPVGWDVWSAKARSDLENPVAMFYLIADGMVRKVNREREERRERKREEKKEREEKGEKEKEKEKADEEGEKEEKEEMEMDNTDLLRAAGFDA